MEIESSSSSSPLISSSPCSSSSSNSNLSKKYDVFLNFRGEDTRKNFMGHLRVALHEKRIETFIDDDKLERGQYISPQLLQAIEDSSCSIVVLSPNYASSTWCLDELVKILDCKKSKGQIVIPIFYHVDPSDIRKQTGIFGEAFVKHEQNLKDEIERVKSWRTALKEVTGLAGLDLKNYSDEANFIKVIVEDISRRVSGPVSSSVSEEEGGFIERHPLGWLLSCFGSIFFCLFFFLVVFPLFVLFVFKIVKPVIEYVTGDMTQSPEMGQFSPSLWIDGKQVPPSRLADFKDIIPNI